MLINLSIENVAVIEKAEVEFSEGFNILTGETGAGKSILMDALSMVLGMRTSRELIRAGAQNAFVSALFSSSPDLSEFDIEPEEDGSLILTRKLSSDGKNICKINSKTVPLSVLKAVGEMLVTIHGQNDNILLLKPAYHLSLLDEYAKDSELLVEYQTLYKKTLEARQKLESVKISESEREQKKDILSFRIDEIKNVSPLIGEDDELCRKRDSLRNFSSIMHAMNTAYEALSGCKDSAYRAMHSVNEAVSMDKSLSNLSEQVTDLYYNAEDLASEINSYTSRMSFSPQELDIIEERLDLITRLKKKYGGSVEECLKNLSAWENELEELTFYEDSLSKLENEANEAYENMLSAGEKLHIERLNAAKALSAAIEEELSYLDMPRVRFEVKFTPREYGINGLYSAEFMISTNPSEEVKPLSKIASGGEMSRIMLAVKSALSDCDNVPVLLFDEIDTGVSGKAAAKIAHKLKSLAMGKQVICITHLPQMACKADCHLLIQKDTSGDFFRTTVTVLDKEGRVNELSRLISGDNITPAARLAAEEMLEEADR